MWVHGMKVNCLTLGGSHGHAEMNFKTWSKMVCHEKSAEVIVPDIVNEIWDGLNIRR